MDLRSILAGFLLVAFAAACGSDSAPPPSDADSAREPVVIGRNVEPDPDEWGADFREAERKLRDARLAAERSTFIPPPGSGGLADPAQQKLFVAAWAVGRLEDDPPVYCVTYAIAGEVHERCGSDAQARSCYEQARVAEPLPDPCR